MLLLQVRLKLNPNLRASAGFSELICEHLPERHRGFGRLSLMGIRHVSFEVMYDVVLSRCAETFGMAPTLTISGRVHAITRKNGRTLPEGVYALDRLPGCRLSHFGGNWKLHFS